jgi:hypothetical protein
MKNIDTTIQEAVAQADVRKPDTIRAAANAILSEDMDVKAGEMVAVIDDPTYSLAGLKVRVAGPSAKGSGWVDVETANGIKVPVQSSLLLKVS